MLHTAVRQCILKCASLVPMLGAPSYTHNWAKHIYDGTWESLLAPLAGKPDLNYLEIGVFEGRSLFWMVDNILTHPNSKATAIDLGAMSRPRLLANLAKCAYSRKISVIDNLSEAVLPNLKPDSFDIIYIDGGHDVRSVMIDAIYSWRLLKQGGLMIFDDYLMGGDRFPTDLKPKPAVDLFLSGFASEIEVLHTGEQVVVRRITKPAYRYHSETRFGPYVYEWYSGRLSKVGRYFTTFRFEKNRIPLSPDEQSALEAALRRSSNGTAELCTGSADGDYPTLLALGQRLGVPVKTTASSSENANA
jgi:predicted O-methyltransferase YrrM